MSKQHSEFERFADMAKRVHDVVAVCRGKHGYQELFTIPFETEEQLGDFLERNHGNCDKIGFYAKGFVDGEYVGENT